MLYRPHVHPAIVGACVPIHLTKTIDLIGLAPIVGPPARYLM
jgi:hypothetical protein